MENNTGSERPTIWPTTAKSYPEEMNLLWQKLYTYTIGPIFLMGLLGNSLILVCLGNNNFRMSSTGVYLSFLSVTDTLFLLSGMPEFLATRHVHVHLKIKQISICYITKYLQYWAAHVSSWTLVAITGERLVVILKPHRYVWGMALIQPNVYFAKKQI